MKGFSRFSSSSLLVKAGSWCLSVACPACLLVCRAVRPLLAYCLPAVVLLFGVWVGSPLSWPWAGASRGSCGRCISPSTWLVAEARLREMQFDRPQERQNSGPYVQLPGLKTPLDNEQPSRKSVQCAIHVWVSGCFKAAQTPSILGIPWALAHGIPACFPVETN